MSSKSETVGRRAKRSEMWDSGTLVAHIWGPVASSGQAHFFVVCLFGGGGASFGHLFQNGE